jgi:class 3 adenylate cyclase
MAIPQTPLAQENDRSRGDIQKIAVLFTDIVGSTRYFKDQGDLAGRKMLQYHQEIASQPIVEHSGLVVKTLGDSVMAYFSNPKEAVKAAIRIQQDLKQHNTTRQINEQFSVRIGIHWGDGIVEEQDIFGDVVNMAAKIVPLAGGGQIIISEETHSLVDTLSPVKYKQFDIQSEKEEHRGIKVYSVLWDDTTRFDPTANNLLYLRPLWNLGDQDFTKAWNFFLNNRQSLYGKKVLKEKVLSNKSVALIVTTAQQAIEIAFNALDYLKKRMDGNDTFRFLPMEIIIDSGPYLRAEKLTLEDFKIDTDDIDPGKIYISGSAYRLINNKESFTTTPPFDYKSPQPLYHLKTSEAGESDTPLFLYQNALAQGNNAPCFYCGARKHKTTDCPSKKLDEFTFALKKLGYLSLKQINDMFRDSLSGSDSPLATELQLNHRIGSERTLASYGFYDLKSHLQLRILRNLWDSKEEKWDTVKTKRGDGEKGGYLWLAQDQLRTSNLREAEKMLNTVILENPQDYRVQCLSGFLEIEKNQLNQAENYFNQALTYAETKPQRLYVLFLLSRICELNKKPSRAEGNIDKILYIYPQCTDARYQKVIFAFRNNQNKRALAELTNLIQEDSDYYIKALIDPELSRYGRVIHPRLKKLYQQAREKALENIPKAEAEMKRLKDLLGDEEPPDDEMEALWEKIKSMVNFARSIVYRCQGNIGGWKKKLQKVLHELESQCQKYLTYTLKFPYKTFSNSIHHQLIRLQKELRELREVTETEDLRLYKQALNQAQGVAKKINEIPLKIKKLEVIKNTILYLNSFFRKSLFVQTLNLLIGFLLPPVVIHYLTITRQDLLFASENVWFYQKLFIVAGSFLGVLVALIRARNH